MQSTIFYRGLKALFRFMALAGMLVLIYVVSLIVQATSLMNSVSWNH
jgi:hypothetical protein